MNNIIFVVIIADKTCVSMIWDITMLNMCLGDVSALYYNARIYESILFYRWTINQCNYLDYIFDVCDSL